MTTKTKTKADANAIPSINVDPNKTTIMTNEVIDEGTPIVVPPDSDFFRYMQRRRGG